MLHSNSSAATTAAVAESKTDRFERRIQSYYNKRRFLYKPSPFAEDEEKEDDLLASHRSKLHEIREKRPQALDIIDLNVNKHRARSVLYRTSFDGSGIT
jgi:hypothetical protein